MLSAAETQGNYSDEAAVVCRWKARRLGMPRDFDCTNVEALRNQVFLPGEAQLRNLVLSRYFEPLQTIAFSRALF